MIYGGYSRGYKAGGYNVDRSGFNITPSTIVAPSANDLEFEPEFVDAYEVGFKSTLFGGSTFFNVNAFYEQFHDYQLNAFSGFNFITRNVEEVISRGVEVDLLARATDNLTFQGGVIWNDAYYDSTTLFTGADVVAAGTQLAGAPEWSVTGAVTYEQPIGNSLSALFYLDARWNSDYPVQTLNRTPLSDVDAFALFNGRIGIGREDGSWSLEFWGRNLTDEYYHVGAFGVPEQSSSSNIAIGNYAVFPSEPRTWGLTLRARY
jgi:outer membrane receptor protein involved in Fe transport